MSKIYTPVSSDFHEMLEALIFEKKTCELIYLDEAGKVALKSKLERLFMMEEHEFLEIESGELIRLDNLFSVNGSLSTLYC